MPQDACYHSGMETWKEWPGHPRVLVSDQGRVARILQPSVSKKRKYPRVNVATETGRAVRFVHRLVLETFRGPRPEGALSRHLNDQPEDNRLENLSWGTTSENTQDAYRNGGRKRKEFCPLGHRLEGANLQVKGHRCKACNQERASAHWHSRPFDPAKAQERYERMMPNG